MRLDTARRLQQSAPMQKQSGPEISSGAAMRINRIAMALALESLLLFSCHVLACLPAVRPQEERLRPALFL
jgi:hypothetical protein